MVVDVHAHIVVPEITADGSPDEAWRPRLFWREGRQVVELGGRPVTAVPREFARIEGIIETQERAGVGAIVLCPWVSLLRYDASADDGLRTCRIYNEALAGLVRRYRGRLGALGMVPLQDPELAARELEALAGLGLAGVEVAASVRGAYLGDDRFRPFWAAAEETGALVFVHPSTRGFGQAVFAEYFLWNSVGNPLETTIAAAHMIMAGVLEAHPRLKVLLAHGGGTILHLRGRLRHAQRVSPHARSRLRGSVEDSLRRFYFDTITHDERLLRDLVDYAGADHVLLGSDYPFDMSVERPADPVRSLGLPPHAEALVLGGNARRLGLVAADG
jgi:aminocarboxymuconate-semialdehyde decarboxylase